MALNQPPKTDDDALASWFIELTREIARLEQLIRELQRNQQ